MSMDTDSESTYRDPERLDLPSASGLEILVKCPGSHNLKQSLPPEAFAQKDEDEDEWAKSGTRIHAAFETGNTLELDAEEAETYRKGVENEKKIVEKWMRDYNLDSCEEGPRELRVWIHDPNNFPELLGSVKIDRHYLNRRANAVLVSDLKSGFNPNLPPSPRSWQLRCAALALWKEEYSDWMKSARVGYCKAQSTVTERDYCDYTATDLEYAWQSMLLALWESRQPDAQLRAGPHCNWCPCKAWCVQAGAYSILPTVSTKRSGDMPPAKGVSWEVMVEQMTPADLAKIHELSTVAEKIIEAVKRRLKALPEAELAAVGLGLGKGRRLDPITNTAEAFKYLQGRFTDEEILQCAKLSKGDLVKLLRADGRTSEEAAAKWIDTNLDPWITRCTSAPPLRKIKT